MKRLGVVLTRVAIWVSFVVVHVACGPGRLDVVELPPSTLSTGLVAHWTFDEGSGDVLNDESGNRRAGTLHGGTWTAEGQFGGALRFEEGDWISVDNFPDPTANWTFSAWILRNESDLDKSLGAAVSTELYEQGGWEFQSYPRSSGVYWHFGYWLEESRSYSHFECRCLDTVHWSHATIVVNRERGQVLFYVDGELQTMMPWVAGILPGGPTLYMGRWPAGGRPFVGVLDDVVVYSRALSGAEILELHRGPPPRPR